MRTMPASSLTLIIVGLGLACVQARQAASIRTPAATCPVSTREQTAEEMIADAFGKRDFWTDVGSSGLAELPLPRRNRIAVALASELSLFSPEGYVITPAFMERRLAVGGHDSPEPVALRRLYEADDMRLHLLQALTGSGEELLITDPKLIAPLINMLSWPSGNGSLRYDADESLRHLTGRVGLLADRDIDGLAEGERWRYIQWWRDWWIRNRDRHPVFDADTRSRVGKRLAAIEQRIIDAFPDHPDLSLLRQPGKIAVWGAGSDAIIKSDGWDDSLPHDTEVGHVDSGGNYRRATAEEYVYVRVTATFATPPPFTPAADECFRTPLSRTASEVFREKLPGTDVLFVVQAASKDKAFLKRLSQELPKLPDESGR